MEKKYIKKCIFDIERHNKELFSAIGPVQYEVLKKDKTINTLHEITSFIGTLGLLTKKEHFPLLNALAYGLSKGELTFFSMHSSALTEDPTKLREKPQYRKVQYLQDEVRAFFEKKRINFQYHSILPDYDKTFPFSTYDSSWNKNCEYIEQISGIKTTRLSKMVPGRFDAINGNLQSYMNVEELNKQIEYHGHSMSTILDFKAPENFSEKQIKTYSIIGIILEEIYPYGILLDIQKKCYPFEQPFYNFARKKKLPIILCGQGIPEHIITKTISSTTIIQQRLPDRNR